MCLSPISCMKRLEHKNQKHINTIGLIITLPDRRLRKYLHQIFSLKDWASNKKENLNANTAWQGE